MSSHPDFSSQRRLCARLSRHALHASVSAHMRSHHARVRAWVGGCACVCGAPVVSVDLVLVHADLAVAGAHTDEHSDRAATPVVH
jgi:hypothetical protein